LLEANYAVIYIAEPRAVDVIPVLGRILGGIEGYVETGALTIIEPRIFFSADTECTILFKQWEKLFEMKRTNRFAGAVAVGMLGDLFFDQSNHHSKVIDYESILAQRLPENVQFVCGYLTEWLDKLSLAHLIALLDKHDGSLRRDFTISPLQRLKLVEAIRNVLAKKLDAETAELIFDTFRLVYKLRDTDIVSQPDKFVDKLGKLLGEAASRIIIESLRQELLTIVSL
jgi:hypothetical protein